MGKIINFVRAFIRNDIDQPPRHSGHDLAKNVRDATGRFGGGGSGSGSGGHRGATEAILKQAAKGKQRK